VQDRVIRLEMRLRLERLADRKPIKRLVKDWQGDFLRA